MIWCVRSVKKLSKKYPHIKDDIENFVSNFVELHEEAISIKKGVFKIRVANSDKNKGKRSGYRVYYYYKVDDIVCMISVYDKSQIEMIDEKIVLKEIVDFLDKEF